MAKGEGAHFCVCSQLHIHSTGADSDLPERKLTANISVERDADDALGVVGGRSHFSSATRAMPENTKQRDLLYKTSVNSFYMTKTPVLLTPEAEEYSHSRGMCETNVSITSVSS